MFSVPWDEDDRTLADWSDEEFEAFCQFGAGSSSKGSSIPPAIAPAATKIDWSEIVDDSLDTLSLDFAHPLPKTASPSIPASSVPAASLVIPRRSLPYSPGFKPPKPIKNSFATMAKDSSLPRKTGAVPLRSALKFKSNYGPTATAKGNVLLAPNKKIGRTYSRIEYDRAYKRIDYTGTRLSHR